jgi:alkyl hydroperoxide reductase subunit AhpC
MKREVNRLLFFNKIDERNFNMLGIGKKFPEFKLKGVSGLDAKTAFSEITNSSYAGRWLVVFFYPKDFTFVCPTEIKGFGDLNKDFQNREAQVLSVSTDNEFVHLAWKNAKDELKNLPFPMLSDIRRDLSAALGILDDRTACNLYCRSSWHHSLCIGE